MVRFMKNSKGFHYVDVATIKSGLSEDKQSITAPDESIEMAAL